jgi:hypothetical protein
VLVGDGDELHTTTLKRLWIRRGGLRQRGRKVPRGVKIVASGGILYVEGVPRRIKMICFNSEDGRVGGKGFKGGKGGLNSRKRKEGRKG